MKLNEKFQINQVVMPGRLFMPPVGSYKAEDDGTVTDELVEHYRLWRWLRRSTAFSCVRE